MTSDETSGKTFDEVLYAAFRAGAKAGLVADTSETNRVPESYLRERFERFRREWAGNADRSGSSADRQGFDHRLPGTEQPHSEILCADERCPQHSGSQR